jgi:hypothetical protein
VSLVGNSWQDLQLMNIHSGKIGLEAFSYIVEDARTRNIPLVLETPCDEDAGHDTVWAVEVASLYELAADTSATTAPLTSVSKGECSYPRRRILLNDVCYSGCCCSEHRNRI